MIARPFVLFGVALLFGSSVAGSGFADDPKAIPPTTPDWTPRDGDLKRDLALLPGRWERVSKNAEGRITFQQEKLIEGNRETLINRDGDGKLISKHAVKFRLEKDGPVRIFSVSERTVYRGEEATTTPTDFSYVYRVDETLLLDAPGLFAKRPTYQPTPVIYKWQRAPEKDTKKQAPEGDVARG